MIIYKITNLVNNKIYIGQTTKTAQQRLAKHWSEAKANRPNNYFHNALLKYGIDNFTIEVIDQASTIEELNEKEKYWIEELNSRDKSVGYNLMTGGKSGLKSEATKELLKEHKIENWKDESLRERMIKGLRKGTERWKEISKEKRVEFICPVCGKTLYLQANEAAKKKYCSRKCVGIANSQNNIGSKVAAIINSNNRVERDKDLASDVLNWIPENIEIIEQCPYNQISTRLSELQEFIYNKYGISDWRTIGTAVCGKPSRKELLNFMKSECEKVRCTGLN